MYNRVYSTGDIKDHVPLSEKSRASCPGGRFPCSLLSYIASFK